MTQTDDAFPPFTQRPTSQEIWRRARADYLAGDGAVVIAERYGLSERSVRRHAAAEGWRRTDVEADLEPPPIWSRPEYRRADMIADNPEYREIAAAGDVDAFSLLFTPDAPEFQRQVFRRAAECVAFKRPAEAASWLRLLRLLGQCDVPRHLHDQLFSKEDQMRAAMIRAIWRDQEAEADEEPVPDDAVSDDAG